MTLYNDKSYLSIFNPLILQSDRMTFRQYFTKRLNNKFTNMEASMFISVASAQRGVSKLTSYFSWVFTFNFEVLLSNRY